ncbi:thrombopoietin receptor [Solea senegalensis]|uniref:Thrombopoietin receptor n=1 Tax=Solea senegalensis TaxID=28829 RepID=A0AAV6S9D4_SOLSE|nr:thrombopoietin receptor [Solea senegalensis]KAG7513832.1 thrombopoietin receptor [Solea senegalensis]
MMSPPSTVSLSCRWKMLLISLWIQIGFVFVVVAQSKNGTVRYLSKQDVLLLKEEQDPKCFTRTGVDFTCFFESEDNRTYDLLYKFNSMQRERRRGDMTVQRSEEGTFLHIYSFPAVDVLLFLETQLDVVLHSTNVSLCSRTVSVEDHFLLDPPFNVALHQNGRVGQLLVSWHINVPTYCGDAMYRIQYSSEGLGQRTEEVNKYTFTKATLNSLVPGEETDIKVTIKCAFSPSAGHWSRWSHPVRAMVPQRADDISLMCYTSDLENITCQWNGSRYGVEEEYKLLFKMGLGKEWTECLGQSTFCHVCRFRGDYSKKVQVKLSSTRTPLSRTFYNEEFTLNTTIKTSAPAQLRETVLKDMMCLKWEAPLLSLSAHLQYEVGYQTRGSEAWLMVSLKGPGAGTCLQVPLGSQYHVRVRAKPNGFIYSGHWSDWSDVLTHHSSIDTGMLLMLCIPISMMIIAVLLISTYFSKLKQYFWPPMPNLDKVLQEFLTEIDRERWDPPPTVKQWPEETTSSVLEIISEDSEVRRRSGESHQLLPPEVTVSCGKHTDGHLRSEVSPDYVTLNKDSLVLCPKGNKYMHEKVGETGGVSVSVSPPPRSVTDLLNYSYVPLTEAADTSDCQCRVTPANQPGNIYTNLPCS